MTSDRIVLTDMVFQARHGVHDVEKTTAQQFEVDAELSVSFIQIGDDEQATRFLKELDDDLAEAKFDIVDTITADEAKGISFNELIARSIYD